MKAFIVLGLMISTAQSFAGTINLSSGESISVRANSDTQVVCGPGAQTPFPTEKAVVFRQCECVNANQIYRAYLKLAYSDGSNQSVELKSFGSRLSDDVSCGDYIKSQRDCREKPR